MLQGIVEAALVTVKYDCKHHTMTTSSSGQASYCHHCCTSQMSEMEWQPSEQRCLSADPTYQLWTAIRRIGEQHAVRWSNDCEEWRYPAWNIRQRFPAASTAATRALVVVNVSNKAVRGASVDGDGADDVDCDDDAPEWLVIKTALFEIYSHFIEWTWNARMNCVTIKQKVTYFILAVVQLRILWTTTQEAKKKIWLRMIRSNMNGVPIRKSRQAERHRFEIITGKLMEIFLGKYN